MRNQIFITVVGQFTNVGDVMHRREILSWLREAGELHVYVGTAPQSFIDGLKLPDSASVYSSLPKWLWAICMSQYGKTAFVFNPGEMRLGLKRLLGELFLFPFELLVRIKKGPVFRIGIATKSDASLSVMWLWKMFFSMSTHIYWRTRESQQLFQLGSVIPDLAFNEDNANGHEMEEIDSSRFLTISMRSDRPALSQECIAAIQQIAQDRKLEIRVVSQVRMDNKMTEHLSEELNSEKITWPLNITHVEQEKKLRKIYRKSDLVLSDRLHVLISAATERAIPAALLPAKIKKVQHHFSVIGIEGITFETEGKTKSDIVGFLTPLFNRRNEIQNAVQNAQQKLSEIRKKIIGNITANSKSKNYSEIH